MCCLLVVPHSDTTVKDYLSKNKKPWRLLDKGACDVSHSQTATPTFVCYFPVPPGECELCLGVWTRCCDEATPRSVTQEAEQAGDITSCLTSGRDTSSLKKSQQVRAPKLSGVTARGLVLRGEQWETADLLTCAQMPLWWKTEYIHNDLWRGNNIHKHFKWIQGKNKAICLAWGRVSITDKKL